MRFLLLVSVLAFPNFIKVQAQEALGDCTTPKKADETSTCVVMPFRGAQGVWYALDKSEMLRMEHLAYPELQLQVEKLTNQVSVESARFAVLQMANKERTDSMKLLEKKLQESQLREQECLDKSSAWYQKPVFWISVGFLIGATTGVAIAL